MASEWLVNGFASLDAARAWARVLCVGTPTNTGIADVIRDPG